MRSQENQRERFRDDPAPSPRIAPLKKETFLPEARALYDRLGEGTRDVHITRTLLRHPKLLEVFMGFGMYLLEEGLLPVRERELLVLRVAWLCRCAYVWGQHEALSRREGLTDAEIARVIEGPAATGWNDFERALLRAADELHADARISDETWRSLAERYDEQRLLEVIFTAGQYGLVCRVANSCGIPLDAGLPGLPHSA